MNCVIDCEYHGNSTGITFSGDGRFLFHVEEKAAIAREIPTLRRTFALDSAWTAGGLSVVCHPTRPWLTITGNGRSHFADKFPWSSLLIYDWETREIVHKLTIVSHGINQAAFVGVDSLAFAGASGGCVYSLSTEEYRYWPLGGEYYPSLSVHPDNRTLIASYGSQGSITVFTFDFMNQTSPTDESSDETIEDICERSISVEHNDLSSTIFSPDGHFIAISHRNVSIYSHPRHAPVWVHDTENDSNGETAEDKFMIPPQKFWSNAVFSNDSKLIYCGAPNGFIYCWEVSTGEVRKKLEAHSGRIYRLALSPDGTLLASTGADGRIKLWGL